MSNEPAPDDLGPRSLELWLGVVGKYNLRVDELVVLHDACREINLIDRMERFQRHDELTSRGSQGQVVAAPMLGELRQHRVVVANLLKQLKLPDSDGRAAQTTSEKARAAANARWGNSG